MQQREQPLGCLSNEIHFLLYRTGFDVMSLTKNAITCFILCTVFLCVLSCSGSNTDLSRMMDAPIDSTPPTVTDFTIPATADILAVPISSLSATDDVGVAGYLITESTAVPSATAAGWATTVPGSYTFTTAGTKTLYAWAMDAAGNVSASKNAFITIALPLPPDTTPPTVTDFTVPATVTSPVVSITTFSASDNAAVVGYLITESGGVPLATAPGWSATAPTSYTFTTGGSKTLYAWAKDAADNISASKSAAVTVTVQATGLEPAGWYAGDMHVHRSCGGSPESVSSLYQKMGSHNLSIISLLADMGNGEVQNAVTDLPLVNGQDVSLSNPERTVHWDAEWHWDPIYNQYPHRALGGHVVALGVSGAHQIWEEYTQPIFNWAHQQNGIAGFAHMQYLGNGIPESLTCCTPMEYPVETALGTSDFISEDVADSGSSWFGTGSRSCHSGVLSLAQLRFPPRACSRHRLSLQQWENPGFTVDVCSGSGRADDVPQLDRRHRQGEDGRVQERAQ